MLPIDCPRRLLIVVPGGLDARCPDRGPRDRWDLEYARGQRYFDRTAPMDAHSATRPAPCADPCPARVALLGVLRGRGEGAVR